MSARFTLALCATTAIVGLTGGAPSSWAQSDQPATAAATSGGIEEVVVTARRREEKAQTVPITLLTFSPETLAKQDIHDSLTLTDSIPGFNAATGASLGLNYTFLRGAPGVVFYWDQVPINVNNQAQGFYFDIANIQVLYGPQGTLFGLSNDAGAILFEPQHPKNDYEGYGQVTFGDYGRETIEAVANVPVIPDKLVIRIGGQYQKQDGYIHVIKQNIDELNQDYWNFRGSATFTPTDDINNEIMVNNFQSEYVPGTFVFNHANPLPAQATGIPLQSLLTFAQEGFINPYATAQLKGQDINLTQLAAQQRALGPYTIAALSLVPTAYIRQLNIVDTASWDITDNITLKNIAGYQETSQYARTDIGGLGFGLLAGGNGGLLDQPRGPATQYNEEIQFQGNFFDNKFKLTAGFFNQWGGASSGAGGATPSNTHSPYGIQYTDDFGGVSIFGSTSNQQSTTHAVYTQGTYDFSDYVEGVSFTGGFRQTWDAFYTSGGNYCVTGNVPVGSSTGTPGASCVTAAHPYGTLTTTSSQNARFRSPSYSLQLNYQWRPQTMFYINNSLGYKTGGFNGQNFADTDIQIYKPEHLNNYEAGVKTDFDFGAVGMESVKARIDTSMFYGVYRGIEIQTTGAYLGLNGTKNLGTPYLDVGNGDIWGWDFQFTVLPFPDLELHGDAEYNKGKYKDFQGPNAAGTGQVSVPGVAFEILPQYKFNGGFTYNFSFIDQAYGEVSLTGVYSWVQHSINSDVANIQPEDILPGHHDIDMSLDWKDIWGQTGLSGRLWVTNLNNNSVINGALAAYHAIGEIGFQPAQPRMGGATLRYEFGPGAAAPVAAAAYVPPPAVAVAPSVPHSYLVFFDFNKSDLTAQAVSIVNQAAANAGPAKVTQLTVTGHTDTVGSDAYNMRLSRRRAESVAAQLEKDGVASSEIEIVAKGKRDLLVPTADGVKEPQNRRVQIVYDGGPTS
jgi:iron complex outermembrane receptor protein